MTDAKACEWAVALASGVHEAGEYAELYKTVGPKVGGFPGLWDFWGDLGRRFAAAEDARERRAPVYIEDFPEAVQATVGKVCDWARRHGNVPGPFERERIVDEILSEFHAGEELSDEDGELPPVRVRDRSEGIYGPE